MNNMKKLRKVLALVLAMVMVLAMGVSVFADTVNVGTGKGSIKLTNASAGQEYTVYKILDATYDSTLKATAYYTESSEFAEDTNTPFVFTDEPDNQGRYYVTNSPTAEAVISWIGEVDDEWVAPSYVTLVNGSTKTLTSGNVIEWTGLGYGYYFVTSGLGAVVTIDSANDEAVIIDKNNTEPSTDTDGAKKIVTDQGNVLEETAAIGDRINFQVSFTATNFVTTDDGTTQITYYEIEDTPTNLSDLTIDSISVGNEPLDSGTDYSFKYEDGKMIIHIDWTDQNGSIYTSPINVVINYHATLDDTTASNDVVIKNDGTTTTIPGHTDIVTATLTINKVDGNGNELDGAWFALTDSEGNNINIAKTNDGYYTVTKGTGLSFSDDNESNYIVAGTNVKIVGLDGNETYKLVEKKAPTGYNMASNIPNISFTKGTTPTIKDGETINVTTYTAKADVVNLSGATLPSTGGMGTTLFYVFGAVLVIGAGIVLVTRRRMAK